MCGLIGAYGLPLDRHQALASIAHRGPDGDGWWTDGTITLGHTRLAIRDVSDLAAQPFTTEQVVLTYNGELWNDDALRADLPGPWATTSDTETVARVLSQHGPAGLSLLDGMWAVAWADLTTGAAYLARDRWGRVPLYYTNETDPGSMFGSSTRWASERGALPVGAEAQALPPGHMLNLATGELSPYPDLEPPCEDFTPGRVLELLRLGVAERLVSDVPVCFLSSGGLDSTLILAIAREQIAGGMTAYTARGNPDSADLAAARRVCAELDVTLREVPVPEPTPELIREAVEAVETPMKAQVEIALAHLPLSAAIAADGYKVCLSGEAADEMFGGYGNMAIKAAGTDDDGYRQIKRAAVAKMARGNFPRVNKVAMRYGVEARLPFMQRSLVRLALDASKDQSPLGKKLLKEAAVGLVPDWVIRRPKATFQGGVGTAEQALAILPHPTRTYNQLAREAFGYLPHD